MISSPISPTSRDHPGQRFRSGVALAVALDPYFPALINLVARQTSLESCKCVVVLATADRFGLFQLASRCRSRSHILPSKKPDEQTGVERPAW